eukprot:39443-Pyramimonas_sp.AAC.1
MTDCQTSCHMLRIGCPTPPSAPGRWGYVQVDVGAMLQQSSPSRHVCNKDFSAEGLQEDVQVELAQFAVAIPDVTIGRAPVAASVSIHG